MPWALAGTEGWNVKMDLRDAKEKNHCETGGKGGEEGNSFGLDNPRRYLFEPRNEAQIISHI